jgi:hypothetical protein
MSDVDTPPGLPRSEPYDEGPPSETTKHLAYGEAALMLIECLMLLLVEQRVFTAEAMVGAVEVAISTKRLMVKEHEHAEIAAVAAGMLSTIANSLAAGKVTHGI